MQNNECGGYDFHNHSFLLFQFSSIKRVVFDGKDKTNIYDSHKTSISILAILAWKVEKV